MKDTYFSSRDVLLLHGLGRTSDIMNEMEYVLIKAGYRRVYNISYPSTSQPIERCIQLVLDKLARQRRDSDSVPLDIVGHSLGGILAHSLVLLKPLKVTWGRVVMLGIPAQGSLLAQKLSRFRLYRFLYGPAGLQLADFGSTLPTIPVECGVIAGTKTLFTDLVFNIWLGSRGHDGKVLESETQVQGQKDWIRCVVDHASMPKNKRVQNETKHFLRRGVFSKSARRIESQPNAYSKL